MKTEDDILKDKVISIIKSTTFWTYFIWTIFVLSLIPLIIIAKYNHGYVDDYWYGYWTHKAWKENHSIIAVIKAIGETVRHEYIRWQGTYSAIAVFSLQPGIWNEEAYFLSTYMRV